MEIRTITRRQMLKMSAMGGLGLAWGLGGCAPYAKNVNWQSVPDNEFSIGKFEMWFKAHNLYNGVNPNLKVGSPGNYGTFRAAVFSAIGATPGIDYSSNRLYAAAEGVVDQMGDIDRLRTGRAGGLYVRVRHGRRQTGLTSLSEIGNPARYGEEFHTYYAHLAGIEVEIGQSVNRGDLIGTVPANYHRIAKLLLTNRASNYVDPDNYGHGHAYMKYWDGKDYSIENVSERNRNQKDIWRTLCEHIKPETGIREGVMTQKMHRPIYQSRMCYWDNFTIMKYLTELYLARPNLFTNIPKDRFEQLRAEFYANQPIVLTLPLKP